MQIYKWLRGMRPMPLFGVKPIFDKSYGRLGRMGRHDGLRQSGMRGTVALSQLKQRFWLMKLSMPSVLRKLGQGVRWTVSHCILMKVCGAWLTHCWAHIIICTWRKWVSNSEVYSVCALLTEFLNEALHTMCMYLDPTGPSSCKEKGLVSQVQILGLVEALYLIV